MSNESILKDMLSIKHADIDDDLMKTYFANTKNRKAKYVTNTHFLLPKGSYYNSESTDTTVGRFILNKFLYEPDGIINFIGYQNEVYGEDGLSSTEAKVDRLLRQKKITPEQYASYLNRLFWIGFTSSCYLNPSLSVKIIKPLPSVEKRKKELKEEYKDQLVKNDPIVATKIEKELLDIAKEELKDDPSYRLYASGARGSFSNNYKNNSVMRGAIRSTANPDQFHVSFDNLVDGISKEEFPYFADMTVAASIGRAINTQIGGYETKKYMSAFQGLVLDDEGTDCHSKGTLDIVLPKNAKKLFLYRYIVENGKLVLLDDDTIDKYIGKLVHMRSPMYCTSEKICSKCAGEANYIQGIKTVGLTTTVISGSIMNASMKAFHNSSLKVHQLDPFAYL